MSVKRCASSAMESRYCMQRVSAHCMRCIHCRPASAGSGSSVVIFQSEKLRLTLEGIVSTGLRWVWITWASGKTSKRMSR